jgi:hypothetical protein
MATRIEPKDSLDDFPTPRWATRAALPFLGIGRPARILEPCCGRGDMVAVLKEKYPYVQGCDIKDYGYGFAVEDALNCPDAVLSHYDAVITNPPFKIAEELILKWLGAGLNVAVLVRTVFLESEGRHDRLFVPHPPSFVYQYAERVPMVRGRRDRKATTATAYAWVVWLDGGGVDDLTELRWIPPSRKLLERDDDWPQ